MMKKMFATTVMFLSLSLFFAPGCSRLKSGDSSNGMFPESVGQFKREIVYKDTEKNSLNDKNKNQKYKSSSAKYADGKIEIFYYVSNHSSAEAASNEQGKLVESNKSIVWKTLPLKDKSGKNVGTITISRNLGDGINYKEIAGGYNHSVAFNNGNQNHHAYVSDISYSKSPLLTDKLVGFLRALPAAAQIELSVLDLITASFAEKVVTKDKLSAINPPLKLAPAAYLKGKTAVVVSGTYSDGISTEEYISGEGRAAYLMDEVGSLVKIDCGKGPSIGQYFVKEKNISIPAYGSFCKVTVIDNTIPAIIAQKSFNNTSMTDTILVDVDKKGNVANYNKESVSPFPTREIAEFLRKLPNK